MVSFFALYMAIGTDPVNSVIKYMIIGTFAFIPLLILFRRIRNIKISGNHLIAMFLFSAVFNLMLVSSGPEMSDDIYRYIWDGKLQNHGISPYKYAPDDPVLKDLHSNELPSLINFPEVKTVYPPISQLIFSTAYFLFGESITGLKLIFILFNLVSVLFFYLILVNLKKHLSLLLLFAWNPLIIMETAINGHLEIVMAFFILTSVYFYLTSKYILSGAGFALAVLTKIVPVIFLPIIFIDLIKRKKKVKVHFFFFGSCMSVIAFFVALHFKTIINMLNTAVNYSSKWYFNNPIFYFIHSIFKNNELSHLISFSVLLLLLMFIYFNSFELNKKLFYSALLFVLFNPTIHPWYLILPVGLSAIYYSKVVLLWSLTIYASYSVMYGYIGRGVWEDSIIQLLIQYIPLLLLILWSKKIHIKKFVAKFTNKVY